MALVVYDRVQETTSTTGTGTITLGGAVSGYQSFAVVGNGNTTYYCIINGTQWEVGIGTYTLSGTTLARTTVLSNSNGNTSPITLAGSSQVFVTYPSEKSVNLDSINTATVPQLAISSFTSTTPVLSFNASNSPFASGASVSGSYLQTLLQNKSGTAGASTNYVLSNDLGTDSSYYGEFGMNSSVFSASTPSDFFSINNGVYFSGHDGDITVGSGNGYKQYFAWGTTGQSAHVINASGAIGLSTNLGTTPATSGTTGYGTSGQVLTSGGSAAAPTWTTPTTGTVTSVAQSFTGGLISVSGSPVTTSGTLALTVAGTSGGIPYFSSTSAWASSAVLTANGIVYGGGAGVSPSSTAAGTTGQFLIGNTSAAPSWGTLSSSTVTSFSAGTTGLTPSSATTGAVTLAGTLGVGNGGTGLSSTPANGALDIGNGTGFTRTTLTQGTGITITNAAGSITIASSSTSPIPAGTVMLFYQSAAPTGWTQVTTLNDYALRIVSGTGGSTGGSVAFSTAFASQAVSGSVAATGSSTATGTTDSTTATGTIAATGSSTATGTTDSTTATGTIAATGATAATGTTDGTTLTATQIPSHTHGYYNNGSGYDNPNNVGGPRYNIYSSATTDSGTGGNGSHTHTFTSATHTHTSGAFTGTAHTHTFTSAGHTHTSGAFTGTAINLAVQYANIIICSKN